jgi:hypothetical protein
MGGRTDGFGVGGAVGDHDVGYLGLFVDVVLVGGFDEGEVLF